MCAKLNKFSWLIFCLEYPHTIVNAKTLIWYGSETACIHVVEKKKKLYIRVAIFLLYVQDMFWLAHNYTVEHILQYD